MVAATCKWIERAVIGLKLCPFARPVYAQKQIRYVHSRATSPNDLLADLERELLELVASDPDVMETTLLIHPHVLGDFLDFNDFSDQTDDLLERLGLYGEIQIATFHPKYQFADRGPDDIENYTNRSPYPTLHLLREIRVEEAIEAFGDTEKISEDNIRTLSKLGHEGWKKLELST